MKITKAIFPAAGFGTRFLPATKAIPKEMLPLVDKPLIQYGVEEARDSGLKEIIIVTGMGKTAIEDHFDTSVELELLLKERKKKEILKNIQKISDKVHFAYTRQSEPLGLGHAIHITKNLVGNEPFAVFLSDDIIDSEVPVMKQMLSVFKEKKASVIAVQKVPRSRTHLYGVIKGKKVGPRTFQILDLVEKPKSSPPSNLAVIGRYILTPAIFTALERTKKGRGGELQLTDGLRELLKREEVYAYEFSGTRFDAGDKEGFLQANISYALKRKDMARGLKLFLKKLKL
ncbi:MAG: UTP--glucose-1-phosphate uridylyltransferase GalU [Thermodesulfobacteriota bacterium]